MVRIYNMIGAAPDVLGSSGSGRDKIWWACGRIAVVTAPQCCAAQVFLVQFRNIGSSGHLDIRLSAARPLNRWQATGERDTVQP